MCPDVPKIVLRALACTALPAEQMSIVNYFTTVEVLVYWSNKIKIHCAMQ